MGDQKQNLILIDDYNRLISQTMYELDAVVECP